MKRPRRRRRKERRLRRARRRARRYMRFLARRKVRRCFGEVIGITGSIGKSSAKEAIAQVLASQFTVDRSTPEYNTELSLLCSVLRQRAGFESPKRWYKAMVGGTWNFLTDHQRFDKLVLEMGVGKAGGMREILRSFRPEVTVFTGVSPSHLGPDFFADEEAIFEEKALLVRTMEHGTAILNRDDPFCCRLGREELNASRVWYGLVPPDPPLDRLPPGLYADRVRTGERGLVADVHVSTPEAFPGLDAAHHELRCPILGEHHIYVLLPAVLTGLVAGLDLEQSCAALQTFALPPSRLNAIAGIEASTIIDSSWNASPRAVEAALRTLGDYPAERRIAVLGSMLNQGDLSEDSHRGVGRMVPRHAQVLITVGSEAGMIAAEASAQGMQPESIRSFDTAAEAGVHLKDIIRRGDVVLVKGSRPLRLDELVEGLMRDPDQADDLLVRL